MGRFIARLLGLVLTLGGAALLTYLGLAAYGDPARWNHAMFAIGMPMMFVLTLFGSALLGGGLALLLRPLWRRRDG